MRQSRLDDVWFDTGRLALALALIVLLFMFCSSCATITAVVEAPEEFWITTERILAAFIEDIWSIIRLFV